ncbi:hypothetical protein [Mycolicibacterium goodii]|nr:hypothetical protein [Mycolicibacterium goodii]
MLGDEHGDHRGAVRQRRERAPVIDFAHHEGHIDDVVTESAG